MDALVTILLVLLAMGALSVLVSVLVVLLMLRSLRRRNRVCPDRPSPAPVSWLAQPGAAARLHRRLRAAVAVARSSAAAAPSSPQLAELSRELTEGAVAIDSYLVVAANLKGGDRRLRVGQLHQQVLRIEQMASQMSLHSAQAQAPMVAGGAQTSLDELAERLQAMEDARTEVARIEADAGVQRVSPYAVSDPAQPSGGTAVGGT